MGFPNHLILGEGFSCDHAVTQNRTVIKCIFSHIAKPARVMQSEVGTGSSINIVYLANVFVAQTQAWYTSYRKALLKFVYFVEHRIVKFY